MLRKGLICCKSEMDLLCFALLWLLSYLLFVGDVREAAIPERTRHTYSRDVLLQINFASLTRVTDVTLLLPEFILKDFNQNFTTSNSRKKRKQGKRGGVRLRLRKQQLTRSSLSSVIWANVQSLRNKVDKLQGNVRFQKDLGDCCIMAFTETWLTEQDQDMDLLIDGFGTLSSRSQGWSDGENTRRRNMQFCDCKRANLHARF